MVAFEGGGRGTKRVPPNNWLGQILGSYGVAIGGGELEGVGGRGRAARTGSGSGGRPYRLYAECCQQW